MSVPAEAAARPLPEEAERAGLPAGPAAPRSVRPANLGLCAVGLLLPLSPAGAALGFAAPPPVFYLGLLPVLAGYALVLRLVRGRSPGRRWPSRTPGWASSTPR
ncbi:hypothetical protein [Kitasatospora sp. MMS16-BH015]|uniref:hypothetical protein n=1 Tax=Kitasatospora sp. MMS16-BH015 TaxID=2018025 RepID=UPI00131A59B1|nr:hypothetical protein [Kitasatospora sp. MMS16-BH015]